MIQMAQGGVKKVIAARISPGENVMEGLKQICEKYNINNGVILSGIGSLDGLEYLVPVILPDKKAGYGYGAPLHVSDRHPALPRRPPYDDIAFKIVRRECDYSHGHGFRCRFANGIFQLWFHL